ncbi:hypothetical protein GCM10011571_33780 [Marinithermofilum abyssi]|uniref:Transmembrane secretion effector n=1 Tax=Marinithermofilum abyssi TaxID=1571185 RepID=A0A8J2VLX3_9BACL|nr:hypothetical protein GCM10011571_33780 [Marinithermofilum abyssi]
MGDWFNQVALAQTVLFLSNSALSVGILMLCRALPSVILGPFVGPFVDRLSKKRTMVLTDLARGIIVLAFILAFLLKQVWILYVGSISISFGKEDCGCRMETIDRLYHLQGRVGR